jgi:hypothetical protein
LFSGVEQDDPVVHNQADGYNSKWNCTGNITQDARSAEKVLQTVVGGNHNPTANAQNDFPIAVQEPP